MGSPTPTPWQAQGVNIRSANGVWLGFMTFDYDGAAEENAAFIVRAANAHEAMVAALGDARTRIAESCGDYGGVLGRIDAALSLARGEQP